VIVPTEVMQPEDFHQPDGKERGDQNHHQWSQGKVVRLVNSRSFFARVITYAISTSFVSLTIFSSLGMKNEQMKRTRERKTFQLNSSSHRPLTKTFFTVPTKWQ
jgi:hypothetical protein